jgi:phage repressor protein C with HTH and peptisase S24 domain
MPKSDLPTRLQALTEIAGSQRKFAHDVGKTAAAVNGWLHGAAPYQSTIRQIAERTGTSPEWLALGEGDDETELGNYRRHRESGANRKRRVGFNPESHPPEIHPIALPWQQVPILSIAQAGAALSRPFVEWHDVEDYEGMQVFATKDKHAIAVRIRGDSMSPDYKPGTIAIIYPSLQPRSENLVIAKLKDGNVLFKRLHIVGDRYHFLSVNPAYAPIIVTADEIEHMYTVGKTERDEL